MNELQWIVFGLQVNYWRLAASILYTVCIMGIVWWIIAVVYVAVKQLMGIEAALERIADQMQKRCDSQCGRVDDAKDETLQRSERTADKP